MTTRPVTSITDEQLAELEERAELVKMMTRENAVINKNTLLGLITRLRAAEADVLRFKEIAEQANVNCRNTAYYLSKYRKDLSGICSGWCEAIKKEMERHP